MESYIQSKQTSFSGGLLSLPLNEVNDILKYSLSADQVNLQS
ncbi:hypothetical protein [Virgibacillus pantothenticus]|nr:hypothetical protein [Virgibacillus pantothenticus]MEB5450309.1 hypothetical protein [Virgibacillus pantothenticus]MEB5454629.1 hypothetical protein [Virgibacillus pantothenticus]MEB5458933.1 hypothetical protein [Virgibacillus pantothenticus]MEB5463040.1 hypothetical protein [Virgibacillus pantothenticus]MEB5467222.1 hypothetical protein [Virgibacillus pantothenticus]